MFNPKPVILPAVTAALLALAACEDQSSPAGPEATATREASLSASARIQGDLVYPMEEELAHFAKQIPGLGGFVFDGQGNLHVNILDMRHAEGARAALAPVARDEARREGRSTTPQVIVHQGKYEFLQLARWRQQMTAAVLATPGVMYNGIAYRENRLVVGLVPAQATVARALVAAKLAELGIPAAALIFDVGGPSTMAICDPSDPNCQQDPCTTNPSDPSCSPDCSVDPTIEGCPEPMPGDGDISPVPDPNFNYSPTEPSYSYTEPPVVSLTSTLRPFLGAMMASNSKGSWCTIGFVVEYYGRRSFTSASHCSNSLTWKDGTEWHQAAPQSSTDYSRFVGREYADPSTDAFNGRYADVAINELAIASSNAKLGYIARTKGGPATGATAIGPSIELDPYAPEIRIGGEGALREAYYFEKIGVKTGWTRGKAGRPCQNISQYGRTWYCSTWLAAGADHGDSGAPVFRSYLGGSCNCVYLVGAAFAKGKSGGVWVSPMSGIRRDFGAQGSQAYLLRTY
ncbi:MAG TPA: hypothetical protein VGR37_23890 [Longimicrobiaceae bacterium]|nr:hypothetical protein [Longimicrobiaceae bacterium]